MSSVMLLRMCPLSHSCLLLLMLTLGLERARCVLGLFMTTSMLGLRVCILRIKFSPKDVVIYLANNSSPLMI